MNGRCVGIGGVIALWLLPLNGPAQAQVKSSGQTETPRAPSTFRSAVDVVSVSAVVRDRKGRFVPNMVQKDFIVAEAGKTREILDFRAEADGPVKGSDPFDYTQAGARHPLHELRTV